MLVHIASRPMAGVCQIPRRGMQKLAEALRAAGAEVMVDVSQAASGGTVAAADSTTRHLSGVWAQTLPDVIHTFGHVATLAAVEARSRVPIVATFDEWPANAPIEQELATLVDCVLSLSRAEHQRWQRSGAFVPSRTLPLPIDIPDPDACASTTGDVICLFDDASLDTLIASMPHWAPTRLVIVATLSPTRRSHLCALADRLGVRNRIAHQPAPRGTLRDGVWARAALAFAGAAGSRHGSDVLEAASHGIPSVAVATDAHRDHVIPGVTGLLVDRTADPRVLGRAISSVLADPFGVRALGAAALVRVRAIHATPVAGANLLVLLDEVRRTADQRAVGRHPTIATNGKVPPSRQEGTHGRSALVMDHLHLARLLAGRYYGHGQSAEDLVQVAFLGLVLAAERFDPSRGTQFTSFAIPTILGELRRYFRENAWAVRVPRGVQEAALEVQRASEELRLSLGHDPTTADLAERLGRVEEDVLLAMRAEGEARSSHSLDLPVRDGGGFSDIVGELDPALELAELRLDVRAALLRLPAREQRILLMRYYGERTQSEIAQDLGLSQVHVSRLLSRTLAVLHDHVLHDAPLPRKWVHPIAHIPSPRRGDQPLGARSAYADQDTTAAAQTA